MKAIKNAFPVKFKDKFVINLISAFHHKAEKVNWGKGFWDQMKLQGNRPCHFQEINVITVFTEIHYNKKFSKQKVWGKLENRVGLLLSNWSRT